LRFGLYRQDNPVRAGGAARYPVHQKLPDPRDERTAALARRHAKREAKDGFFGRAAAALDLPFRLRRPDNGGGKPRAERLQPSRGGAICRCDHLYSGASGTLLPFVPSSRPAVNAQGARLDEHEQLAGEHHRLRHLYPAYPLLTGEVPKGALRWTCTRRSMVTGPPDSGSRSIRSSPARSRVSPNTAFLTGR